MQTVTAQLPEFLRPVSASGLVRIGGTHDGGYVVSRAMLERTGFLLSFGLDQSWAFEAAVCDYLKASPAVDHEFVCHAYGKASSAPKRPWWARKIAPVIPNPPFDNRHATHFSLNVGRESGGGTVTLRDAMDRVSVEGPVLLKIDIEGWEYNVLKDVCDFATRVSGVVFELHGLGVLEDYALVLLLKLMSVFDVVHVHANNHGGIAPNGMPQVIEVTMVPKSAAASTGAEPAEYPLPDLDAPNDPAKPDIALEFAIPTVDVFKQLDSHRLREMNVF